MRGCVPRCFNYSADEIRTPNTRSAATGRRSPRRHRESNRSAIMIRELLSLTSVMFFVWVLLFWAQVFS